MRDTKHSWVIAGLDPAIPIVWHGRASMIVVAGLSPATTMTRSAALA
jgi:hypothetical protein